MKVILFVDCQQDFMNRDGALYVPGSDEIKPVLDKITKLAKDEKIPILKTMDCHIPNDKEFQDFPPHCIAETVGQASIIETAAVKAITFNKKTYDIFHKELGSPEFEPWLKKHKVTEVWACGVATDWCLKFAVIGILNLGINVYIFQNAISGVDEDASKKAIKEMCRQGAHLAIAKL